MPDSSLAEIITAIAAITGAITAAIGVNTWRSELKGRAEFDAARNLMRSIYKSRQCIASIRSPFIFANEFPDEYKTTSSSRTPEQEANGYAHVFKKRWEPLSPAIEEIELNMIEAEILLGKDVAQATKEFMQHVRRLQVSIETFIEEKASHIEPTDKSFSITLRRDIFDSKSKDNELSQSFESSVSSLERLMVKHLKG
ncbi:hypothetical protein D3C84_524390 [compost metagenome]